MSIFIYEYKLCNRPCFVIFNWRRAFRAVGTLQYFLLRVRETGNIHKFETQISLFSSHTNCLLTVLSNLGSLGSEEHFWEKIVKEKLGFQICFLQNSRQGLFVLHLISFKYFKKLIDKSSRPEVPFQIGVLERISQDQQENICAGVYQLFFWEFWENFMTCFLKNICERLLLFWDCRM